MKPTLSPATIGEVESAYADLEPQIREYGFHIFSLIEDLPRGGILTRERRFEWMMQLAASDPSFKVQLFRFIDVLPTLRSSSDILEHLNSFFAAGDAPPNDGLLHSPILRLGLRLARAMPWWSGSLIKSQAAAMARQFLIPNEPRVVLKTLERLRDKGSLFTVDLLGETVVSEAEAEAYAGRCMDLLNLLAGNFGSPRTPNRLAARDLPEASLVNPSFHGLNLSIKISALYSQILPTAPDTAVRVISARLRPLLRRAAELGALVNFDMENYAQKGLTLRLFKSIFSEAEFASQPATGLALQAYLRDSEHDLKSLLDWSRNTGRRFTVRLVKGAYWDYETIVARQRNWPEPVYAQKWQTDHNYEALSLLLLQNLELVDAAFGTHNIRSVAHVLAQAARLGIAPQAYEFQMLYGMARQIKAALLRMNCRLREYCPIGQLLPGMGYLVRRLLENSSNEGFLASTFLKDANREDLLKKPGTAGEPGEAKKTFAPAGRTANACDNERKFRNVPHTDFTLVPERKLMLAALSRVRGELGRQYPLIINGRRIQTREWLPSLNPANQNEVIGFATQAGTAEAEAAIAAALKAECRWARTPAGKRAALLDKLADVLDSRRADFAALEILEAGKNWTEADADVAEAIDFCRFYGACMRDYGRPFRTQAVPGESNYQEWRPRGIGVIIAPWNFPLAILTGMMAAAVVAGNPVVLKPSDLTPVIAGWLMRCVEEAGFPNGVINLLTGPGAVIGDYLVSHPAVAVVAFTGSKAVGLRIFQTTAMTQPGQLNLKKVVCEMGGKNCVIIDDDADVDEAVMGCLSSAFGYQGQKCSALSRLVLVKTIEQRFLQRFVAAAASLPVGPGENPGTVIGPVISREAQERIFRIIEAGKNEARLHWQGSIPNSLEGCYVAPTIFTGVPPTSRLFREEIFGPVLSITTAGDFDEGLRLANDSEFALTGGVYSRNPEHIAQAKSEFICGNLYINRTITGAIVERQPFGGFHLSGGGTKAGGREYLQHFMVPRVITENLMRHGFAPDIAV